MPTYEYACKDCGHSFEIVQSMKDDALTMCPRCGGTLRKVFAPPAIAFKGSGFYATDHGKKAKAGDPSEGAKDEPAGAGKREPTGDAKGEASSKPKEKATPSSSGAKERTSS
jgi:putative FmdB family regulatory protein